MASRSPPIPGVQAAPLDMSVASGIVAHQASVHGFQLQNPPIQAKGLYCPSHVLESGFKFGIGQQSTLPMQGNTQAFPSQTALRNGLWGRSPRHQRPTT